MEKVTTKDIEWDKQRIETFINYHQFDQTKQLKKQLAQAYSNPGLRYLIPTIKQMIIKRKQFNRSTK